jgi:hypothetical protein
MDSPQSNHEGKSVAARSDSFRREFVCVILDGPFGDGGTDAYFDATRYWQIRDELITWPIRKQLRAKA